MEATKKLSEDIRAGDTLASLAYRMLGDARLVHEIMIPGHSGDGPLPVGKQAFLRDEKMGPPTRNWTQPR